MVLGLSADLDQTESPMGVNSGIGEHFEETGLAEVVGTGAGDESTAGAQHLQGAEIEFFIAAEGGIEIALGFGEGGWVEPDRVIAAVGGGVVLEQVEGVGLDPLDFTMVEGGILVGDFERGAGTVDAGDARAVRGKMQAEASLIAEHVEGFAAGVLSGSSVVFALVEEGSGFLAFESVIVEADT